MSHLSEIQHNFIATTAPTVNDDETGGYEIGSTWFIALTTTTYSCYNASAGGAVWIASVTAGPMDAAHLRHSVSVNVNALATDNILPFDTNLFLDASFTHDTVTNNSRIFAVDAGTYQFSCGIRSIGNPVATPRYQGNIRLRKNGTTDVGERYTSTYARFTQSVDHCELAGVWVVKLEAGDYVELLVDRDSSRTTAMDSIPIDSMFQAINLAGGKGEKGETGPGGNDPNAIHVNVASEISGITEKVALVGDDLIVIEDSESANVKKRVKLSSLVSNVTPIQEDDTLSGTENDYATSDIETVNVLRFTLSGGDVIITGIVPPSPERTKAIIIFNVSNAVLKFQHNDSGSAVINRFLCPDSSEFQLARNSGVSITYDVTSDKWRLIANI